MTPLTNDPAYINDPNHIIFFKATDKAHVDQFAKGASLEKLVDLVSKLELNLSPFRGAFKPEQDQTHLNYLSEIKKRLANAIEMKRNYYDNHPFGIITKYFLMFFGRWNNGDTAAIISAENFLLLWDSREAVFLPPSSGKYVRRKPFLLGDLQTKDFYNYNPRREIELNTGVKINYKNLRS